MVNTTSPYSGVRKFHIYYDVILSFVSYALNCTVIYLAIYKTRRSMRDYSAIILLSCGVDLIFNSINLIACENVDMRNGILFMFSNGFLEHWAHPWPVWLTCFWLFGILLTIVNVPMQFIYRYSLLCRTQPLTLPKFCLIYSLFIFWIGFHALMTSVCFKYGADGEPYKKYLQQNPIFRDDTPEFIAGDSRSILGVLHVADCQVIVFVSYTIIGYTGYRIWKKLDECRGNLSPATLAAQRQLTNIMVLQASYPFIVLGIPVSAACFCTVFHYEYDYFGILAAASVSVIPVANALSIILLVPNYRRTILRTKLSKASEWTGAHNTQPSVQPSFHSGF